MVNESVALAVKRPIWPKRVRFRGDDNALRPSDLNDRPEAVRVFGARQKGISPVRKADLGPRPFQQRFGNKQTQAHAFVVRPLAGLLCRGPAADERITYPAKDVRRIARAIIDDPHRDEAVCPGRINPDPRPGKVHGVLNQVAQTVNHFGVPQDGGLPVAAGRAGKDIEGNDFAPAEMWLGGFPQHGTQRSLPQVKIVFSRTAHRAQDIAAAVCLGADQLGILAQGCDHDEMCNDLERAAADAQTYAEMADEAKEAKRAELEEDGHRSMASRWDHLFDPEVA